MTFGVKLNAFFVVAFIIYSLTYLKWELKQIRCSAWSLLSLTCTSNPKAHLQHFSTVLWIFTMSTETWQQATFWHWSALTHVHLNCRYCKIWLKNPSDFEQACTKNCISKPTSIRSTDQSNISWKLSAFKQNFRAQKRHPSRQKKDPSAEIPAHLLHNLFAGSECDLDGAVNDGVEEVLDGALHGRSDQGDQHGVGLQERVLPTQPTTRPHNTSNTTSPAVAWTTKWGLSARVLASNHGASHPQKSVPPTHPPSCQHPVCINCISGSYTWFWHYYIFKYQMHSRCISAMLHAILRRSLS